MLSLTSGLPVFTADSLKCDPAKAVCFTGHRPEKILPYKGLPSNSVITYNVVTMILRRYIELVYEQGCNTFISGLAKGVDLWAAREVARMKEYDDSITLVGVMPYLRHAERAYGKYREELTEAEVNADMLITVSPDPYIIYSKGGRPGTSSRLYSERNHFMVDHSCAVIAFYDEDSNPYSGTGQTVRYAEKTGKRVYSFGLRDVYDILERSGCELNAAAEAVKSLSGYL